MDSVKLLEDIAKERIERREQDRLHLLNLTIHTLKEYFFLKPVKSVYITGSLIHPDRYHENSDIDIAVTGMPESSYFTCLFELSMLLNKDVEIIELENCRFRQKIESTGLKVK